MEAAAQLGSDISWIALEDRMVEEQEQKQQQMAQRVRRPDPDDRQYAPRLTTASSAIDRLTSGPVSDTDGMETLHYQQQSSSRDETTLRRRATDYTTIDHSDEGGQYTNNPFMDALYEEIIKWFPNLPLRSKDQLYFNMIQGLLTLKEVVTTPISPLYRGSWNDSKSHSFFDFLRKTISPEPRSHSAERIVNEPIYWIHDDHIYWSILHKNFVNGAALTAVPTGPSSQFLAISKPLMDDIVEFVWTTLVKTGRVQNPIMSYR